MEQADLSCVLCKGTETEILETASGGYSVIRCRQCGLARVFPFPPIAHLQNAYTEDYYRPWIDQQRSRREAMWKRRLKHIEQFVPHKGHLLDVGCAEGFFLELALASGWQISGTEFSSYASRYTQERLKEPIFNGELMDAKYPDNTFDMVTLWHVLEHTTRPLDIVCEIYRILKPGGWLVLAVPNLDSHVLRLAYRLARGRPMHLFDPQDRELHLYHFNQLTLTSLLEKAGLHVHSVVPDRGQIKPVNRLIDGIAVAGSWISGKLITEAIEARALKPV